MNPFGYIDWPCPSINGGTHDELALVFDKGRQHRLLVLPAWFDEANKLRRQTVEIMRRLDLSGIDCFLPDLAGCNESEAPLPQQTLASWRHSATAAAREFAATHVFAVRAGGLIAPEGLPGWVFGPVTGAKVLRTMLRARAIAAREAGKAERVEDLQNGARIDGIELAGWTIGAQMFRSLEAATPSAELVPIDQDLAGGTGFWRRAEPGEDPGQADALAAMIAIGIAGT
ncbi:hypothetical protein [Altererythrobacter sp. TH136]|uniref:hypothetical protein n=1 Tax=Altererythrobacter sp. TH136 TaxID=2067415 RepID=UPI001FEDC152|nr:hypothetical protein [Altererythrobacter sp. TH136]